jgi:DNA-binding response OmpR family regulator
MAAPSGVAITVIPRLTRKESALLALLQNHPRQCLSRNLLLRTVWGYQEGVKSRTVDVHVQRLRKKLGPEIGARIMTVFRCGYLWNPNGSMPNLDF